MKQFKTIYKEYITEGVYDPGIFKAFFLAGGPGSGKTFVTQTAFAGTGLKIVNSDKLFEIGLKQSNLSLKMPDEEEYFRDMIRQKAKITTNSMLNTYIGGRLGLIIDATSRDLSLVQNQQSMLRNLGYDCYMIFVNTSLEVALERNSKRERSIPDYIAQGNWKSVQANIGTFQRIFSPNKMLIIDNNRSEQELITQTLNTASRFIRSKLTTKPENGIALNWIRKELEARKRI
jgi:predicted kinase